MDAQVAEKVRKLLRLAQSDNEHEAALAASRAQELIDRHRLDVALLEMESAAPPPDEEIVNFGDEDDALTAGKNVATWRWRLAFVIAKHNAVKPYTFRGRVQLIGRPSDVGAVRYLFAYCARETERLVAKQGKGHGRTWLNNYRLGVVEAIAKALEAQREASKRSVRSEARAEGGAALIRIDTALARVEERNSDVIAWASKNMKFVKSYGSAGRFDSGAREAGRRDGKTINLGVGRGIGAGARRVLGS